MIESLKHICIWILGESAVMLFISAPFIIIGLTGLLATKAIETKGNRQKDLWYTGLGFGILVTLVTLYFWVKTAMYFGSHF